MALLRYVLFAAALSALRPQDAADLLAEGEKLALESRFAEALPLLDQALELEPGLAMAWNWHGHCHAGLGNPDVALVSYERALALQPDYAWTHYAIGMAQRNLGHVEASLAGYSRAIELDPAHFKAWQWRGFTKNESGDHRGAVADLSRALALQGDDAWTWFARGRAFVASRDFAAAITDFHRACQLTPQDARPFEQQGYLHLLRGDNARALGYLRQAEELAPGAAIHPLLWIRRLARDAAAEAAFAAWHAAHREDDGWDPHLAAFLATEDPRAEDAEHLLRVADELARDRESRGVASDDLVLEAHYYVGLAHLDAGRAADALHSFRASLALGPAAKWEWDLARLGLRDAAAGLAAVPPFEVEAVEGGSRVTKVSQSAGRIDLRAGDVLIELDGWPATPERVGARLASLAPGDLLRLLVQRASARLDVQVAVDCAGDAGN